MTGVRFEQNGDTLNMTLFTHATISFTSTLQQGDDVLGITDVKMQIRRSAKDPTVIAEFSVDNGRVTISSSDVISYNMTATDSAELPCGLFVFNSLVTLDNGNVVPSMSGRCEIVPSVTR